MFNFDSWISDAADKVTAGVIERLWAMFMSILSGIGWGTILFGIGALLVVILVVRLLWNPKVLALVAAICLIAGYVQSKGVDTFFHALMADEDAKRVEKARALTQGD